MKVTDSTAAKAGSPVTTSPHGGVGEARSDATLAAAAAAAALRKRVQIYADGSCLGNPGPGGWGVLLSHAGHERELSGGEPLTTNNRMELMAAIMALEALREPCSAALYTDSRYVQQGIGEWLPNWIRRGWKTAAGAPVKNQDLWQRLDAAAKRHQVEWHWVKGHAGHVENERVDVLARNAAEAMRGRA